MARQKGTNSKGGLTELRQRILFVLLGILIYRIGAHIPVPGLDPERLAALFDQQQNTIIGLANLFSGGALSNLTIFAIGIMPYITASIIIQLFTAVSPALSQLKKEGESGRKKINQYTRYATLFFSDIPRTWHGNLSVQSRYCFAGEFFIFLNSDHHIGYWHDVSHVVR